MTLRFAAPLSWHQSHVSSYRQAQPIWMIDCLVHFPSGYSILWQRMQIVSMGIAARQLWKITGLSIPFRVDCFLDTFVTAIFRKSILTFAAGRNRSKCLR